MNAPDGLGERRRDGDDVQLRCRLRGRQRIGGDDLTHQRLRRDPLQRAIAEQPVRTGDTHRPSVPFAQPVQELDDRGAAGDLVVEHDDVAALHIANDRADRDPLVAVPLLRAGGYWQLKQPRERGRVLRVAQVRRHDDGVGQIEAGEVISKLTQGVQVIDRDGKEPVHLR